MMPTSRPSSSTTPTQPSRFLVISRTASARLVLGRDQGQLVALVHQLFDAQQLAAELAARVEHGEVARREIAPLEQRHRQRVAQRQHAGGRGGGRQAHRAGLADLGQQQAQIGRIGQRARAAGRPCRSAGSRTAGYRGSGRAARWSRRSSTSASTASCGRDHAEIAVAGLGRMDVRCAGVPVEDRVAAILRATWPLLPMPVTTTRPVTPASSSTAAANVPSIAAAERLQRLGLGQDHPAAAGDRRIRAVVRAGSGDCGLLEARLAETMVQRLFALAGRPWRERRRVPASAPALRSARSIRARLRNVNASQRAGRGEAAVIQCAKMSWSGQPARSSSARNGRKSKQAWASWRPAFAREHLVEARPQRMQMEHVAGGIAQLRLA